MQSSLQSSTERIALLLLVVIMVTTGTTMLPNIAVGASSQYTDILATGTELCITVTPTSYDFGSVVASQTILTDNYFVLTSCCVDQQDVEAKGTDMTGSGGATWTLADNPGDSIYALRLDPYSGMDATVGFAIIADYTFGFSPSTDNTLGPTESSLQLTKVDQDFVLNMDDGDVRNFKMFFEAPTANVGFKAMAGQVILTATLS